MVLMTILLIVWAITFQAPIEEPANPARTPNPSKAPWYFLGLQEMLVYYDPWLAGVVFPTLIIVGLMAIPYIDKNPKGKGYFSFAERRVEITLFLFGFLILWVLLLLLGTFLRGPNWNFFGPYEFWDTHKLEALVNVNLSEYFWVKMLNTRMPSMLIRELPGMLLVVLYMGVLPVLLATRERLVAIPAGEGKTRTLVPGLKKYYDKLGPVRYSVSRPAASLDDGAPDQDGLALAVQPEVHRGHAGDLLQHLTYHFGNAALRRRSRSIPFCLPHRSDPSTPSGSVATSCAHLPCVRALCARADSELGP